MGSIFNSDNSSRDFINLQFFFCFLNIFLSTDEFFNDDCLCGFQGKWSTVKPQGQNQVSTLQRCPYYRDREYMIFGISGTKQSGRNREVSVLKR